MPDLSKLTDDELLSLKSGGLQSLSNEALTRLRGSDLKPKADGPIRVPMSGGVTPEEQDAMYARKPPEPDNSAQAWGEYALSDVGSYVGDVAKKFGMQEAWANRLGRDANDLVNAIPGMQEFSGPAVAADQLAAKVRPPKLPSGPLASKRPEVKKAYTALEGLPAYKKEHVENLPQTLRDHLLNEEGAAEDAYGRTYGIIKSIEQSINSEKGLTPKRLDKLRKRVGSISNEEDVPDALRAKLDDLMSNELGGPEMAVARAGHRQAIQAERLENAVTRAQNTADRHGGDFTLHLKKQIQSEIDRDNTRRLNGKPTQFDDDMTEAMHDLAASGNWERFVNTIGKLSPDSGFQAGINFAAGVPTAVATGGWSLIPQAAGLAAAFGAKKAGQKIVNKKLDALRYIIEHSKDDKDVLNARKLLQEELKRAQAPFEEAN